jgi:hypothetical protein
MQESVMCTSLQADQAEGVAEDIVCAIVRNSSAESCGLQA